MANIHNRLAEFFSEKWDAVCSLGDLIHYVMWKLTTSGQPADQADAIPGAKPTKGKSANVSLACPGRPIFRPVGKDYQNGEPIDLRNKEIDEFLSCRIDPMQIFYQDKQGRRLRKRLHSA